MKGSFKYHRVMAIEDNEIDRFIFERTSELSKFSKHVHLHNNGKSALEDLFERAKISSKEDNLPEVIFIDLNMPIMDGFEFLERYADCIVDAHMRKLVVLTSSVTQADEERVKAIAPGITILKKPLTRQMLEKL